MDLLNQRRIIVGKQSETQFKRADGIRADGTLASYRDVDGKLWAMSGHSNSGRIGMFCGNCIDDLAELYPIAFSFADGHASYAFSGIRYPEGIKPRGAIWPFGLYICPGTHRFFCFFHNETAWRGRGTGYDAFGYCDKPAFDSDFRHVGLMHSDDEGKSWVFDRWVLTGYEPAFTERYNPGAGNAIGQRGETVRFGCGDFCMFIEPRGDFIYLFYDIITMSIRDEGVQWLSCNAYVARTRKRDDGLMGDFVKYYDGAFCEAGNLGRESAILTDMWHPRVVYSEPEGIYIMTGKPIVATQRGEIEGVNARGQVMQISISEDLVHWSEPQIMYHEGNPWGNHYNAIVPDDTRAQPCVLTSDRFSILNNHNGTDVDRYATRLVRKP